MVPEARQMPPVLPRGGTPGVCLQSLRLLPAQLKSLAPKGKGTSPHPPAPEAQQDGELSALQRTQHHARL